MVKRREVVESEEYDSEGELESSCSLFSGTSYSFSRSDSSSSQNPEEIPRAISESPPRSFKHKGYHPGYSGLTPSGSIGESPKILPWSLPSSVTREDLLWFRELYCIPEDFKIFTTIGD